MDLLKTAQGWLSLIPAVATGFDTFFGFLPISSFFKPWIYFLIFVLVVYAFVAEITRYKHVRADPDKVIRRRKRARWILAFSIFFAAIFSVATQSEELWWPEHTVLRELARVGLALSVALAFERFTRALLILGLYRPNQTPPAVSFTPASADTDK